jgi:uncharacterized protein (DUF2147 family)
MKKTKIILMLCMLFASAQAFSQTNTATIFGKWKTEDNSIVEFSQSGTAIILKQVSTPKEKDKKDNGKQLGKNIIASNSNEYKGIVIDPSNNKEYKGTWTISSDGKKLKLKVKWGFINFSETWDRQ